jgi:flagellin-like protein
MTDRRGQSEIIGLVVIFGIVIAALALVAATGFAGLQDAQHVESANNGLRAFEILDANVDDLVSGRAPERTTEVKLAGGQLELGDPVTIEVRSPGFATNYSRDVVPIEYDLGKGTRLVYVGGALLREEGESVVMLREPTIVRSDVGVILPVLETRAAGTPSVGGSRVVTVRTHLVETDSVVAEPTPHRVEIGVTSPHADAWQTHFEALACDDVARPGAETVVCTLDPVDAVYVTAVRIDVSIE